MAINNMGRPKVEKPKNIQVKTYVDEETYNKLLEYCNSKQIGVAYALREAIGFLLEKE